MILFIKELFTKFMRNFYSTFHEICFVNDENCQQQDSTSTFSTINFIIFRDYKNINAKSILILHKEDLDKSLNSGPFDSYI